MPLMQTIAKNGCRTKVITSLCFLQQLAGDIEYFSGDLQNLNTLYHRLII